MQRLIQIRADVVERIEKFGLPVNDNQINALLMAALDHMEAWTGCYKLKD